MKFQKLWTILTLLVLAFLFLGWPKKQVRENVAPQQSAPTPIIQAPNTLYIEKLGITVPIIFSKSSKESDIQEALIDGVAHYPGTALPGEPGNVYIVGHSSDNPWSKGKYTTVFARLPELTKGDLIKITDEEAQTFTYQVLETKIISARDFTVLSQPSDKKLLTLQTSYPIGTSLRRFVVIAELVK